MSATDQALIGRFLEMMAAESGASRNTIAAYSSDLSAASSFLAGSLVSASEADIARLSESWADLARASVARKSACLRRFFGFLEDERMRVGNPSNALPRVGARRGLPKTLNRADIDRMFAAANRADQPDMQRLRAVALLELLYGSGLRATELVSLDIRAFAADRPYLIVKGKGGKERLVPLSDRARQAVADWLGIRPAGGNWLFPSGRTFLSRVRLFQIVRDIATSAGIPPDRVSPHVLRHAFATHMLEGGADLRALQALLGHSDIATTEIYTHVDSSRLVDLVRGKHPLVDAKPRSA